MIKNVLQLLCILFLFFSCNSKQGEKIPEEIKLAYIPYSADLPFFVAIDNGYFKKNGLNIKPILAKNTSEALDLVLSEQAVGSMGNSFSVLFSIHSKDSNQIRLINVSAEIEDNNRFSTYILTGNSTHILTAKDLIGKRIGTEKGLSQVVWVNLYLQKNGISPKNDVTIIEEDAENLLNGLKTNQFDAIFVFEPYGTIGLLNKCGKEFQPFFRKSIMNPFPAGGAVISKKFIDKYPVAADLVIKSLDEAIEFINKNPELAKKSLVRYTPIDSIIAMKSNIYFWWSSTDIKSNTVKELSDIMFQNKVITKKIDVYSLIY